MAVITISRQYGSRGDEVAAQVCEKLGYRFYDKRLMAEMAAQAGLADNEVIDFSEDEYKLRTILDRLFTLDTPRIIARISTWQDTGSGAEVEVMTKLNEKTSIALVQSCVGAAYQYGNVVIVGRGGQAILADKPDVLHVRLEAPLDDRIRRLEEVESMDPNVARDKIYQRDKATAEYLRRFYKLNWADPLHYHLVINLGKYDVSSAASLIVNTVEAMPSMKTPEKKPV